MTTYNLAKGPNNDVDGSVLRDWLNSNKENIHNIKIKDTGAATIENMSDIFYNYENLINANLSKMNISNVAECYRMFQDCPNLTNVSEVNFSNCNNCVAAFSNCSNLTTFPIKLETFKNDSKYRWIYNGCVNITEDITNINVNNCELNWAFSNCPNITKIHNLNISNCILNNMFFNMSNVTDVYNVSFNNCSYIAELFKNMSLLTNISNFIIDISGLAAGSTNLTNIFYGCDNLSNDSYANIANMLPIATYTKTPKISDIGLNVERFDEGQLRILGNKSYEEAIPYIINSSNVSNYWNIYDGSAWTNIEKNNYDITGTNLKLNISTTTTNIYIEDIGNEGTLYYMKDLFSGYRNLQTIDISNLKTEKVTIVSNAFRSCNNLISVSNFNTSNVINADSMFWSCTNLISIPNFDTSNVKGSMASMFVKCYKITNIPNFNTSNVTDMGWMFSGCNNLVEVPDFNTSKVIRMANMFFNCFNLTNIPNFDTSNVTNMEAMFCSCRNLTNIPNFDTDNVTNMKHIFSNCFSLTEVPNLNTSKVTNAYQMFYYCKTLTTIPNLNISKVTNACNMFYMCENLVNVPNFDTGNIINMSFMFYSCNNLVDVPQFNTSKVNCIKYMFCRCNNLSNASIQNIINMCLNSNITDSTLMNLNVENSNSPLYQTKFDSSYYSNRLAELTAAGWNYLY